MYLGTHVQRSFQPLGTMAQTPFTVLGQGWRDVFDVARGERLPESRQPEQRSTLPPEVMEDIVRVSSGLEAAVSNPMLVLQRAREYAESRLNRALSFEEAQEVEQVVTAGGNASQSSPFKPKPIGALGWAAAGFFFLLLFSSTRRR